MSKTVEYSLTYKKNLGNFENIDIHVGASAEVADGVNPADTLAKLRNFVEDNLGTATTEVVSAIQGD